MAREQWYRSGWSHKETRARYVSEAPLMDDFWRVAGPFVSERDWDNAIEHGFEHDALARVYLINHQEDFFETSSREIEAPATVPDPREASR